jgi:hypothetical protein
MASLVPAASLNVPEPGESPLTNLVDLALTGVGLMLTPQDPALPPLYVVTGSTAVSLQMHTEGDPALLVLVSRITEKKRRN